MMMIMLYDDDGKQCHIISIVTIVKTTCKDNISTFLEYTSQNVCGISNKTTTLDGRIIVDEKLQILPCHGTCANASYTANVDSSGKNVTGFGRFCISNQSFCDNLFEYVRIKLKKSQMTIVTGSGACCRGDLCNIDVLVVTTAPTPNQACSSNPCRNAGTCVPIASGYICQCSKNFTGIHCEQVTYCFLVPCLHGGTCTPVGTTFYRCTCQSGYSGKRCEKMDNCTYQNLYDHSGAQMMPDTYEYRYRCFQVNFPDGDIYFYEKKHSAFYICRNGIITFNNPWGNYWPYKFGAYKWQLRSAIIAPFWALVDTSHPFMNSSFYYRGHQFQADPSRMSRVYYQIINKTSSPILEQATNDVRKYSNDSSQSDFKATLVIIVTWENLYPQRYSRYYSSPYYHLANKFQLVLITDGVTLFGMFVYPCRGIQWVVRATGYKWENYWDRVYGLPVAAWNSGTGITNKFSNLPGSSSFDIGKIDEEKGNVNETGRWFFRLNEGALSARVAEQKCINWHSIQLALRSQLPIPSRLPRNFICPCTFSQNQWDRRFRRDWWYHYYYQPKGVTCGITRRCIRERVQIKHPEKENFLSVWISVCQRCCYSNERDDFGSLMVGPQYGGSMTIRAYWYGLRWYTNDDDARQLCCEDSNLCHLYYSVRPSDTCDGYRPPRRSFFWGDPHLVTLDNKNYTFNGLGEYIIADVGNGLFQLQARTKKVSGDVATVFSAAAAKETSTSKVEIKLDDKGGLDVIVNGSVVNVTSEQNGNATEIGNLTLSRDENNNVIAAFPSGISVGIGVVKGIMMSITFSAPEDYKSKTKGLLGVWNDNMEDDFTLRNGTIIPVSSSGRTIHKFGLDWQITKEESLFTYGPDKSVDTYKNTSYTPLFVDELKFFNDSLKKQAEAICGSNVACLFDAAATKDASVGEASLKSSKNFENETKQLENFPPVFINATKSLKMIINQKTIIELNAIDKNNDPMEFVYPSLSGLQGSKSANKLTLEWTITSTNKVNFTVVVKDTKGASSTWTPTIALCACQNGNCTDVVNQSGDRFQVMPCECKSGYTGSLCESDINGCEASGAPCYPGVVCTDLPPPNGVDGFKCGPCPNGFSGNGDRCIDIDECINGTSTCEQNCINTPGSFICACKAGYRLKSDQRNCEDIDECEKPVCQDKCTNTNGTYQCECNEGFKVDLSDSSKCVPNNTCNATIAGCQHVCYILNGQKCSCNKGYKPNQDDGKKCDDINECSLSPKPCSQKCTNNNGSYVCGCNQGYRLQDDKSTCEDINECVDSSLYNCPDEYQVCINTEGAYRCECAHGLEFRDGKCREKPPTPTPGPTTTPTPTPSPRTPTEEEKLQSVLLRVLNMKISDWTEQVQSNFKKAVYALAKGFCKNNKAKCGLQESQRKRRAAADPEYNEASVHLLPGYPKENGTDLLIAFYVLNPGSGSSPIPVLVLIEIMKNGTAQIKTSLGDKKLGEIQRLFAQTTARPTTSAPASPPSETWKWIVIGVVCGVFLLIIIIVIVIFCMRKANNEKRPRISVGDPNEAYHDDEQLEMEKVR